MSIEINGKNLSKMYIGAPPADATKIQMSNSDAKTVAEAINENKNSISQLNKSLNQANIIKTAGGSANALTLSTGEVSEGLVFNFIAFSNNGGNVTTINGIPLYKPNTTTAPILIEGKAYTVWYNSSSNCFFIKASAEGTAVAGDVLAGKTFSNDNDTTTGSMPNNEAVIKTLSSGEQYNIPQGFHNGNGKVTAPTTALLTSDANAVESEILFGRTAYVKGSKITGNMPDNGAINKTLTSGEQLSIPRGYHNGVGIITAQIAATPKSITYNCFLAGSSDVRNALQATTSASNGVSSLTIGVDDVLYVRNGLGFLRIEQTINY